jgi:hypothetical protein
MLSELTRTIRAAMKAGVSVERYEVDPKTGRLILYPKLAVKPEETPENLQGLL